MPHLKRLISSRHKYMYMLVYKSMTLQLSIPHLKLKSRLNSYLFLPIYFYTHTKPDLFKNLIVN